MKRKDGPRTAMVILMHILTILFAIASFLIIKNKRYQAMPLISGTILISFLGCGTISVVSIVVPYGELFVLPLGCVVFGVVFLMAACNDFYSLAKCREKINGIYRGYHTYYGGNGISTQSPVFEYLYHGTLYQEQTTQSVSYKQLTQHMRPGETYPIYVDPKHPAVFLLSKKIRATSVLAVLFGILFFTAGISTLCAIFPVFWSVIT